MKLPKIEKSEILYDEFIKIRREILHHPDGHEQKYYTMISYADAVSIIALREDGKFLFNKEYRHSCRETYLSCPGGFLDRDELPEKAAERELLEETGYRAKNFIIIGNAPPMPGLCSQRITYILATGLKKVSEPQLEPSEILQPFPLNEVELNQYIVEGNLVDGILCTAFQFYRVYNL